MNLLTPLAFDLDLQVANQRTAVEINLILLHTLVLGPDCAAAVGKLIRLIEEDVQGREHSIKHFTTLKITLSIIRQ